MKHATLQSRLITRLLVVLLGFGLLCVLSLNSYLRAILETEVEDKARLVFAHLLAVQTYVRENLRPAMYETLPPESFVMEAMSTSYVTRKVMSDLNTVRDQFSYRRVALDPRNPLYGANDLEREFIDHFQRHPDEQVVSRFMRMDGEEVFVSARPVVFEKRCLTCHGRPEEAPGVMLARYGAEKGFGRFEGEIGGLDSLIMPVEREQTAIRRVSVLFVMTFICGTLFILGLNHFFFDRIMVLNIGRLANLMRSRFPAEADETLGRTPREEDEIEAMVEDMERFADHLQGAKAQLADYAANLESMVQERTAELRQEAEARQADVQLFLDMLDLFARGVDRRRLMLRALEVVAGRFEASRTSFHCFFSMNRYDWPDSVDLKPLSPEKRDLLLDGDAWLGEREAMAPVQTAGLIRGALALEWAGPTALPDQERDLLMAMGRQLGIALENLEAMESLLSQKAVLESIFEGIADPLFLLDGQGGVVHANEAANQLLDGREDASRLDLPALAAEATAAGRAAIQRETLLPDGRSVILRAYPLTGLGRPGRTIVYVRDNTMEKTMLAKLQQGEKSLAVGMLAAGLAHEINNPLGVILTYARLLWDDGKSAQAEDLEIIVRHTLQAQKVLADLMRFARPKPVAQDAVNLADAVAFIARVFSVRAVRQGIVIETALPPDLPPVRGNMSAMEQILTNLMVNAMDALEEHGRADGRIVISACQEDGAGEVRLTVADNGPGVPEENMGRLFDPFFTTKAVGKGTGLGLAVVYGLVRDLGGRIEAENREGAVFTIHLRAEPAEEEAHV